MCSHFDAFLLFTSFISISFLVGKNIHDFLKMHDLRIFFLEKLLLISCWWDSFFRERCPWEGGSERKRERHIATLRCGSVFSNIDLDTQVADLGFPSKVDGRYWTHKVYQESESHFPPFNGTVDSNQSRQIVYISGWFILLNMVLMKTLIFY